MGTQEKAAELRIRDKGEGVWRIGGAKRFWSARTFRYRFSEDMCGGR